jgi:hypothetical protein
MGNDAVDQLEDAELVARAAREIQALAETTGHMELALQPSSAFTLASVLQLALRHPGLIGEPERIARLALDRIRAYLNPAPAVQEMLRRGDDPAYDVHDEEPAATRDGRMRLRYRVAGGHVHCRLFSPHGAKHGDLVFDTREWLRVHDEWARVVDVLPDEACG